MMDLLYQFLSYLPQVFLLFLLYTASKIIYRLYFHPLSKFPGPKLAAATFWYERYYDVFKSPGGQYIYQLDKLHKIHGPIIRASPEEIHVQDSQWYDTLCTGPGHIRDKWDRANRANGSPGAVASATAHAKHKERRAAINPFFSKKAIDELEGKTKEKVNLMCKQISKDYASTGKILDLGTAFTAVTLDVITEYCFDKSLNCLLEKEFASRWKKFMTALFDPTPVFKHFPLIMKTMSSLPRSITLKMIPEFSAFFQCQDDIHLQAKKIYLEEQKAGRIGKSDDDRPKTIFHGILQSKLPDSEKTISRMADEAFVLIVAGGETTARVLTYIFASILQNPQILARLREEIDTVMPTNDEDLPSSRILEELPYFKAVIQEGLRMAAPVTNRPILIAPAEDLKYGEDFIIPRGTPVSMTLQDVLYDPKVFPEPDVFRPERWIEAAERRERLDRFLVTFSKGTRACVGMNLSTSELYLGTAALVKRFDLELEDFVFERDLKTVRDNFVGAPSFESRGVRVKVTARVD